MRTFKDFLVEIYSESESSMILNQDGPPLFISPSIFKRVFNIPDKEALHLISTHDLLYEFPKVVNKAKTISTFTFLSPGSAFYNRGVEIGAYPPDAFVHVKGRVAGMFNQDVYSSILHRGGRAIELNVDTIDESDYPDKIEGLADDLRNVVRKLMGGDYPVDKTTMDGKAKNKLIKNYLDAQEKLMNSPKYKPYVADFMVDLTALGETHYNEIIMDKVKPLAIYLKGSESVSELKSLYRVPIHTNINERTILDVLSKLK